jgi:hypothetical protein
MNYINKSLSFIHYDLWCFYDRGCLWIQMWIVSCCHFSIVVTIDMSLYAIVTVLFLSFRLCELWPSQDYSILLEVVVFFSQLLWTFGYVLLIFCYVWIFCIRKVKMKRRKIDYFSRRNLVIWKSISSESIIDDIKSLITCGALFKVFLSHIV